jgi:ribose transport system ATP-binding protein
MGSSPIDSCAVTGLLEARGICKSFPGVQALDNVDITVHAGRLNAVLGENGAGKSTLMNILAGVFPPDQGEIRIDGHLVAFRSPRNAQQAGISIIYQELNLVPELTIAENIFLGREPRGRFGLIDYASMNAQAHKLAGQLELDADPRTRVSGLRLAAQQIVEIAKALAVRARVIIMDEPTSALATHETELLFRLIGQLKQTGVGIIYITHRLDELPHIADDITVLRDGRLIGAAPFTAVAQADLVRMMVGRELVKTSAAARAPQPGDALSVRGLSLHDPGRSGAYVLHDISFSIRRGEVVGLFGLRGAGRTELLQTIFGLHPHSSEGDTWIGGKRAMIGSPRDAIDAGLALAPEDRKSEGLVLSMGVVENTSLPSVPQFTRLGLVQRTRERNLTRPHLQRLAVKSPRDVEVRNLSGGNQQKVVLAKWLATKPTVLLLDEPTRGIDIGAKREIYSIIEELARSGLAVLIASSELPELLTVADRILVLSEGRLTAQFARSEATEEAILEAALPRSRNLS